MPRKKNKKRQSNGRKKKHSKQSKQNKINHNELETNLFVSSDGLLISAVCAVLRGSVLYLYSNKNNSKDIPYDIIDISHYNGVNGYTSYHPKHPYVIHLKLHVGNDADHNPASDHWLYFENKHNLDEWGISLGKITKSHHQQNNKSFKHNVIYSGWTVLNNDTFYFIELKRSNDKLFVFNNNNSWKRKKIMTIKLNNFQNISSLYLKMKNKHTLFKYGFILKSKQNNDMLFYFKRNNHRYEWLAHIDYIIHRKVNIKNHQIEEIQHNDIIDISYNKSVEIIKNTLKLYDRWKSTKNEQMSLQSVLQQKIKCNYMDILNCFHCIVSEHQKHRENNIIFHCNEHVECEYIQRHRLNNKRKIINTKQNQSDIALCDLLDKVHCYLCHSHNNKDVMIRQNISNKFVIDAKYDEISNKDIKDEHNINDEDEKCNVDHMAMFEYSTNFDYYDEKTFNYISPHFSCLKEELISNPYYKITVDKYYSIYEQALYVQRSAQFQNIRAIDVEDYCVTTGICPNEQISINHIISLLIYCNETEIQYVYKKHTRKNKKTETFESLRARQSFIAHWTRYLYESTKYGTTTLKLNEYVYAGINTKLIFDSFIFTNKSPLSTSSDVVIANRFATNDGIIMKLQNQGGSPYDCMYFDMTLLSDYPAEKEKFFCGHSKLNIVDIIIQSKSHKLEVSALRLLDAIMKGILFYYEWNADLIDNKSQTALIKLLEQYINSTNHNDYWSQLTAAFIESFIFRDKLDLRNGTKLIFINKAQCNKLNPYLSQFFDVNDNDQSESILFSCRRFRENMRKIPLNYMNGIRIYRSNGIPTVYLNKKQIETLQAMEIGQEFEIAHYQYDDCYNNGFEFDFSFKKKTSGGIVWFCLNIKIKGITDTIKISWDMVCRELKVKYIQSVCKLSKENNYRNMGSVFPSYKIQKMQRLSIDLNVRVICFLIS